MKASIRVKLIGILALASIVPLLIAAIAVQTGGYNHLVREQGSTFKAAASQLAGMLNSMISSEVEKLSDLVPLIGMSRYAAGANQSLELETDEQVKTGIEHLESIWPQLTPSNPDLISLLGNPLAVELKEFQKLHPLFAEILVTDRRGRLIAATGKTEDYWQADETWWKEAMQLPAQEAWLEGPHMDVSANTISLDVSIPLLDSEGMVQGAMKAALNISMLFNSAPVMQLDGNPVIDIIQSDRVVLLRLTDKQYIPASESLSSESIRNISTTAAGWQVTSLAPGKGDEFMVGHAPLRLRQTSNRIVPRSNIEPLGVFVYRPAEELLAPLRHQVVALTLIGCLVTLVFVLAGLWIANRRIIAPVRALSSVARKIAATVEMRGVMNETAIREASERLSQLDAIQTADELEEFARDFSIMARRVLRYQQQLEEEITSKTRALQQDLQMAREFQEALMPNDYPEVPAPAAADPLCLRFHHLYQPASSVSGDFFDVFKIGPHQAGVFIADVMGHGARSALVTAILRTLLQNSQRSAADPVRLLELLNRQFHQLIRQTNQTLFVSAFYLVADTLSRKLHFASAGHPSPLLARKSNRSIQPLIAKLKNNPAIGLFPESKYTRYEHDLEPGDLIVLFTDGLVEALNPAGAEFGLNRLMEVIRGHLDGAAADLAQDIKTELARFVAPLPLADDVCVVTVEIDQNHSPSAASHKDLRAPQSLVT